MGKKKQPLYKVVAADSRSPRDGKFLESIGLYNPLTDPSIIEIKEDRALYWLGVGAQPTETVKSLLSKKGILLKRELIRKGLSEDKVEAELESWNKLKEAKSKGVMSSKKAKAATKTEAATDSGKEVSTGKAEKEEEKIIDEGTTEVKGATSEETATDKE
jgi:small subunit ribosomal protein S16